MWALVDWALPATRNYALNATHNFITTATRQNLIPLPAPFTRPPRNVGPFTLGKCFNADVADNDWTPETAAKGRGHKRLPSAWYNLNKVKESSLKSEIRGESLSTTDITSTRFAEIGAREGAGVQDAPSTITSEQAKFKRATGRTLHPQLGEKPDAFVSLGSCAEDSRTPWPANKKLVLFADEDFIAINKPSGVAPESLAVRIGTCLCSSNPKTQINAYALYIAYSLDPGECSRVVSADVSECAAAPATQVIEYQPLTFFERGNLALARGAATVLVPTVVVHGGHCSGAVLFCRSRAGAAIFRKAIAQGGSGTQQLLAIVEGPPPGRSGVVKIPLRYDKALGAAIPCALHLGGSAALTNWTLLGTAKCPSGHRDDTINTDSYNLGRSVLLLLLETDLGGIPDQIRAHCAFGLQCPLKGDKLYMRILHGWRQAQGHHADPIGTTLSSSPYHSQPSSWAATLAQAANPYFKAFPGDLTSVPPRGVPSRFSATMAHIHTLADLERQDKPYSPQMASQTSVGGGNAFPFMNGSSPPSSRNVLEYLFPHFSFKHCVFIITIIDVVIYIASVVYDHSRGDVTSPSQHALAMFGANIPEDISRGQFWRLLCPIFLHNSILHLLVNAYMQIRVGAVQEAKYGTPRILIAYLVCGILANLISNAVFFCNVLKVGASTAIFGLIGIDLAQLAIIWPGVENRRPVIAQLRMTPVLFFLTGETTRSRGAVNASRSGGVLSEAQNNDGDDYMGSVVLQRPSMKNIAQRAAKYCARRLAMTLEKVAHFSLA
ncbi:uncharacterized protein LOC113146453 [Cyclospora cayetanensis]|uniref:Rhomboid-like protease n=1 Tax=Cyclospora cayetanensis TaxID=88456 RepID=A0A6P6RPV0_9EIME|nr:uncharacterized protein LOC113146453 [Cyclospora cayetanensis]